MQPFQRKILTHLAPACCSHSTLFFSFFSLYILLNNNHLHLRKKFKKLPNINKWQGITPILLFFLNISLKKIDSGKTKSVQHSPGLPYCWRIVNKINQRKGLLFLAIEIRLLVQSVGREKDPYSVVPAAKWERGGRRERLIGQDV
jgi:hypothetical protein